MAPEPYLAPTESETTWTEKPDYSYTTTDFPNDPTDEVTVEWRDFTTPANAGPDASTDWKQAGVSGGGKWAISASNITGVDTYPTYAAQNSLEVIIEYCAAFSTKFIIKLSGVVDYQIDDLIVPTMGASHAIIWAPDDGSNGPSFWFTAGTKSGNICTSNSVTSDEAVIELRNISFGLVPSMYADVFDSSRTGVWDISGITAANPPVVTSTGHTIANDTEIFIANVGGMTEVNKRQFTVKNATANTFELYDSSGTPAAVNGTGFTAYTSGGTVTENLDFIGGGDTSGSTNYSNAGQGFASACNAAIYNTEPGGVLIARNGVMRGATTIVSSAIDNGKDANTTNSKIWLYDMEIYDGSSQGNNHNVYTHALSEFRMVRCKVSNSGIHVLKLENHSNVLLDNYIVDDDPDLTETQGIHGDAIIVNFSGWQDIFGKRNVISMQTNSSSRKVAFSVSQRANALGGTSDKVPYPFDPTDANFGGYRSTATRNPGSYDNGSKFHDHSGTKATATASAGATTVSYFTGTLKYDFNSLGAATDSPTNTATDHYRLWIQVKVTATGAYESHETLATSDNAGTFTLATAIPTGREVELNAQMKFVPDATGLSAPKANPICFNRADANYYWDTIDNGSGALDRSLTNLYHWQVWEDLSVVATTGSVSSSAAIGRTYGNLWIADTFTGNTAGTIPPPPINNPEGPTGGWPDNGAYGEWDAKSGEAGAHGSVLPTIGSGDFGSDVIWPQSQYLKNVSYEADAGAFSGMFTNTDAAGTRTGKVLYYETDFNFVDTDGTVTDIGAAGTPRTDTLTRNATTLSAGAALDASSIVVTSATGVSAGKRIHIHVDGDWGGTSVRLFSTTVDDSYVSGTTIPLTDNLPRAASNGARVQFIDNAGTSPGWFPDEATHHPSEEHI